MADSFELKAIITAVDKLSGPLKGMSRQLKGFQKEFTSLTLGAGAAGTAILGSIAGMAKEAMGLENHMADARKAIHELHDPKAFQDMTDQIVDMSTRLPMAAEGIAEIVAEAGNAGIPFNELTTFAEDATKAAVGFGMTAEEAGHQLAVWRTAFKLTQPEVMKLSDQMNYLSMIGPTTEKQIGAVVTTVGNLATTAGVTTSDLAAIAATITGVGVNADVAGTGVQNFMLALTNANTTRAQAVLKSIGLTSKQVAAGMQKDSRGMMLQVLEGLSKVSPEKRAKGLEWLFGRESIKAIAPLLTNLDQLKKNFNAVSDSTKYAGATQKEYDSRVNTTEKQLQILKNQFMAAAITIGNDFLPLIVQATKAIAPYAKQLVTFVRNNPELVKSVAKFGVALAGVAVAMGGVSRAVKLMNFALNMTPAKALIGLLVWGAYEIIQHWDEIGPVFKDAWRQVDDVVQKMGGWESAIKSVGAIAGIAIGVSFISNVTRAISSISDMNTAITGMGGAMGAIGKITMIGGLIELGILAQKFEKDHPWLVHNFLSDALNSGLGMNQYMDTAGKRLNDGIYNLTGFRLPRADGYGQGQYSPSVSPTRQQAEIKVTFDNAPQGLRIANSKTGDPMMRLSTDVGYSPFRNPQ